MKTSTSYASLNCSTVAQRASGREWLFYSLGTVALAAVVLLWNFSNYLTASVLDSYNQPLILAIASCLSFQIYFVFLILPDPLIYILQQKNKMSQASEVTEAASLGGKTQTVTDDKSSVISTRLPPLTLLQTATISFFFFVLYFLSNLQLIFSLKDGALEKISNLVSTSGFFTLLIGYVFRVEAMSMLRFGAVLLSLVATLMTVVPGFSFSSEATQASIFALSSAFTYGCYSIYLKMVTKDESRISMPIVFAFVGLYTMLLVVPGLAVAHVCGWYKIHWPSDVVLRNTVINAVVGGLLPNYMWNVAFAFTTPLMVAIGLSFSTPLGVAFAHYKYMSDPIKNDPVSAIDIVAAVIIIISFAVLNLASLNKRLDNAIDRRVMLLFFPHRQPSIN